MDVDVVVGVRYEDVVRVEDVPKEIIKYNEITGQPYSSTVRKISLYIGDKAMSNSEVHEYVYPLHIYGNYYNYKYSYIGVSVIDSEHRDYANLAEVQEAVCRVESILQKLGINVKASLFAVKRY